MRTTINMFELAKVRNRMLSNMVMCCLLSLLKHQKKWGLELFI